MPMPKSVHLSLRLTPATSKALDQRAHLSGERKTALGERYVEEGLRMDNHPGVHFVDGPAGRRPALDGTGLDVWEVIETVRQNDNSVEAAAGYLEIPRRIVDAAVRYYADYRDEIDDWIERVQTAADEEERRWLQTQDALR